MNNKLKVVDVSTLIPGPFSSYLLEKHLNAEIVKMEDLNQPDALRNMRPTKEGIGLGYQGINGHKKVISVDFRGDGSEVIKREASDADVFIHNFKPGRISKLGLDFQDLKKINRNLIYCSISGYPAEHRLSGKAAHDLNILALCGYLHQQIELGAADFLPPLLLADVFTSYHAVVRIMAALITGKKGTELEISMYEAFSEAMYFNNYPQLTGKKDFSGEDFLLSGNFPCYAQYKSKEEGYVVVAAIEKSHWVDFCTHLKREEWIGRQFDPGLKRDVAGEMVKYDRMYWIKGNYDFCVTPVLSALEATKI